ncbi:efflux transporter outer membrane subunit [Prosthecobacter fluviatilis]|uniref:Efflux transporter outer membrane subunit n=1 Tax=Prosthecobacter fluviatilis TaxID=445931 RepID=A0ABW0KU73_9BACT
MKPLPLISAALTLLASGCAGVLLPKPITAPKTILTQEEARAQTALWRKHFTDPHLGRLIDQAIAGNNDLKIAFQRVQAARAQITASRGALAPALGIASGVGLRKFGYYTMDDAGNRTTTIYKDQIIPNTLPDFSLGLQTAWEVDLWGKLRSQRDAAMQRTLASVAGRRLVLVSLISDIATHYYDLLALDTTLTILDDNLRLQERAIETVQAQKAVGAANSLAIQQFEARARNLRSLKLEARQEILDLEAAIRLLLGNAGAKIQRSQQPLTSLSLPHLSKKVPASLLTQRPDVIQAEHEVAAARSDVKAARAAFLPSLNINGVLGFQAFRGDLLLNSHSAAYSIAGGLVAPLVNRAAIRAQFQKASAEQLETLAAFQQSIVNAYVEVHNRQSKIRLLDELHKVKSEQVGLLAESVATSNELFATRRATYLEVLNAQQTTLEGRLELVDVNKRRFQLQISLYKALGGG